jgi:hypothetical protein
MFDMTSELDLGCTLFCTQLHTEDTDSMSSEIPSYVVYPLMAVGSLVVAGLAHSLVRHLLNLVLPYPRNSKLTVAMGSWVLPSNIGSSYWCI